MITWWTRLLSLFRTREMDRQLDDELRFHLDMETDANVRRGRSRDQARRAALCAFGDVGLVKEDVRETWLVRFVETLGQDVRYGVRTLAHNPGFTAVVVASMALGIGANTAIFSVVNGVLLKPLPYERGEDLLILRQQRPLAGTDMAFSYKEILDYRTQATTLDGVVEFHDMWFILLGRPEPERVSTGVVSANFFDVLGVRPILGRTFRDDDETHGAPAVLVLSYPYWRRSFGGDSDVVGRVFRMNDRPHTVVGVLPPIPQFPEEMDVYMPTSACPFRSSRHAIEARQMRMMRAFARRKPGVPLEQVRSDLAVVAARLAQTYPDAYPKAEGYAIAATPLRDELTRQFRRTVVVLLGTAGFVLLIVCASVANLLVARLVRRSRELAVRSALGAGRGRLLRQLLTESTTLALAGGLVGLLLASVGLDLLIAFAERFTARAAEITIDARVLLFTLGMSILTGLIFGAIPSLTSRQDALVALREGGTRVSGGRHALRAALVVGQVAVSFMLLIGAGLMLRSLMKLQQLDPGFTVENVLTMRIDLNFTKYRTAPERTAFVRRLLERLEAEPGVTSAAGSANFPLNDEGVFNGQFVIEGKPVPENSPQPRAALNGATPHYFSTIGIPLRQGRLFTKQDHREAPPVVLVSSRLARRYWAAEDPIGRRLSFNNGRTWATVVGVVGDARQRLAEEAGEVIYAPLLQISQLSTTWLLRTAVDPSHMARQVRAALREIDPEQPVDRFRTLEQVRASAMAPWRLTATLVGVFAALALTITAIGIGGVIAFSVSERVQEFGIRMALGAQRAEVLSMVLGQGLKLAGIGLAIGVAGALLLTGLMANLLFGIEPTDAPTFVGVSGLLAVVATVACLVPARRAASVDPIVALRAVVLLLALCLPAPLGAQPEPIEALEGYDPVLVVQGKEVPGKDALAAVHGRFKYFFATEENRTAFEKDPARFAIQLDGACARMGAPVTGNPNIYAVHDGRIYIFGTSECHDLFEAAPARYLEPPSEHLAGRADETAAARATLDRAAAAMGGAALDGLTSFEEQSSYTSPGGPGMPPREIRTALVVAAPDRIRFEQTFPGFGTVATVLAPTGSFASNPRATAPLRIGEETALRRQVARHPVFLLHARREPGFRAVARGADRVAVQIDGGPIMTLQFDAGDGRLAGLSYRGRGPAGEFGELSFAFGDFRAACGLTLPFRTTATFDGAPAPQLSRAVESIAIDQPIDAARFVRAPVPERK